MDSPFIVFPPSLLLLLLSNRVPAPARVGAISPVNVIVPAGPTGCDPGQTSFFQVLQIATKITKGQIEITTPVELLKLGDKVRRTTIFCDSSSREICVWGGSIPRMWLIMRWWCDGNRSV